MILRRSSRSRAVLLALTLVGLLSGCTSGITEPPSPPGSTTVDMAAVKVSGKPGAKPSIRVPAPFSVSRTTSRMLRHGKGPAVKAGQRVTVQYVGVNGTDGKEFDTSWGRSPATFVLDVKQYLPGLVKGLTGVPVGSRVLVAVPPRDGYGVQGAPAVGIGPTDTLVVVVDLDSARNVLTRAKGTPVPPKKGLPTVRLDAKGKPTITVPKAAPPTSLVVRPLITGKGAKVRKSEQITVNYAGVIWATGRVFDSSWKHGKPSVFSIGVGRVIAGWDVGLVGQPVGSQVLLVIPPDQGYGADGKDSAGIRGTDTLVFVVDILDAG